MRTLPVCHLVVCRDMSFTVFLSVTPSAKSTEFGSRYLVDGLSKQDKIWQIDRGGFAVHQFQDLANRHLFPEFGELWSGVPQNHTATCISPSLMQLFRFFYYTWQAVWTQCDGWSTGALAAASTRLHLQLLVVMQQMGCCCLPTHCAHFANRLWLHTMQLDCQMT